MQLSVEISFYPLEEGQYKDAINQLIHQLQYQTDVEVIPNRISTQIFGEFEKVTTVIHDMMRWSFDRFGTSVFIAKYINSDRRPRA